MQSSPNDEVHLPILTTMGVSLAIKREDKIHPYISGNKYRKLKYNLLKAKEEGYDKLLTFGGAYSNHIAAVAAVGGEQAWKTVGVIRGEELVEKWQKNTTLQFAASQGMVFHFVNREKYKLKETPDFIAELKKEHGSFYLLPEGGTNELAVKGCEEIVAAQDAEFDCICSSVGTGGTLAGILNASHPNQKILGFSALKGDFLNADIRKFTQKTNWKLETQYHFGGYAKVNLELINFINYFKKETQIALDPIYTAKMIFGILDKVKKGMFARGTRILAIHTGGLQAIAGMNSKLESKKLPLIEI